MAAPPLTGMEVAIGLTIYLTFGAWLIMPHLGAPLIFTRLCIGLCASEFIAATAYAALRSEFWGSVAGTQIPIAAAVTCVFAFGYSVFVVRGW
jgi:hypothetical protein